MMTRLGRRAVGGLWLALALLLLPLWAGVAMADDGPGGSANVGLVATGPAAKAAGYYVLTAKPGEQVTLPFDLLNPTKDPVVITVYASDAVTAEGGGMSTRTPDQANTADGLWLRSETRETTLKPGERRSVPFQLTVPKDADAGQHVAVVVARTYQEGADPGPAGKDEVRLKINTVHQVYIAVQVTVPGPVVHQLQPGGVGHEWRDEQLVLHPVVNNSGNVIEKPQLLLTVRNAAGEVKLEQKLTLGSVYPHTAGGTTVMAPPELVRTGDYQATLEATDSTGSVTRADFPLPLPKQEVKVADQVRYDRIKATRTDDVVVLPLSILLPAAGGLVGLVLLLWLGVRLIISRKRRAQRRPLPAPPPAPVAAAPQRAPAAVALATRTAPVTRTAPATRAAPTASVAPVAPIAASTAGLSRRKRRA